MPTLTATCAAISCAVTCTAFIPSAAMVINALAVAGIAFARLVAHRAIDFLLSCSYFYNFWRSSYPRFSLSGFLHRWDGNLVGVLIRIHIGRSVGRPRRINIYRRWREINLCRGRY